MASEFDLEGDLEFEEESDFEKRLREGEQKKKKAPKKKAPKKKTPKKKTPRKKREPKNKVEPEPESSPIPEPQTQSIDPEPMPGAATAPPLTPNALDKENQREIDKANRQRNRERREAMAEQKRLLREQIQNEAAMRRQQYKEQKTQSKEAVSTARSEAISQRVKTYALGSALGFPGYVVASVADAKIFRPREETATSAQTRYQADLQRYNEQLAADARMRQRQQEADIRNTPVQATQIDPNTGKPIPPPPPGSIPPIGTVPPVVGGGAGGTPPPIRPTPPGPLPQLPPLIEAALGPLNAIIVGTILGLKAVNSGIDNIAASATTTGKAIASGNATAASKGAVSTFQKTVDPLGIAVPLNVAVKGFDFLLDINESILQAVKQNEAFAPQTLQADVEGQILMLGKQIEVAQKLDKMTSELVRANTTFELAWQELRAELLEAFLPLITSEMKILASGVKVAASATSIIGEAVPFLLPAWLQVPLFINDLKDILNKQADELDDTSMMNQIKDFFDPTLATGKMRQGAIPNP